MYVGENQFFVRFLLVPFDVPARTHSIICSARALEERNVFIFQVPPLSQHPCRYGEGLDVAGRHYGE